MIKYNINSCMYIKITEKGWLILKETVGDKYINDSIKIHEKNINGEIWYKLRCWEVFDLLPPTFGNYPLFETNVMFDNIDLIE